MQLEVSKEMRKKDGGGEGDEKRRGELPWCECLGHLRSEGWKERVKARETETDGGEGAWSGKRYVPLCVCV